MEYTTTNFLASFLNIVTFPVLEGGKNSVISLPVEIFQKILGYLSLENTQQLRLVGHQWKKAIESPQFGSIYFSHLKYSLLPARLNVHGFIRLIKQWANPFIDEINLDNSNFKDKHVKKLSEIKTNHLSIRTQESSLTPDGFIQFLRSGALVSPVSLDLAYPAKKWFNDKVLKEIIEQKLSFCSLNLPGVNCKVEEYNTLSEKFCEFIRAGGLISPCQLNLTACRWVSGKILDTLIEAKVKFNSLSLRYCSLSQDDLCRFIQSGALTPCREFLFNNTYISNKINNQLLRTLSEEKLVLENIDFSGTAITPDEFITFIKAGGLASPCTIKAPKNFLTKECLIALAEQQIEIKSLNLEYSSPVNSGVIEGIEQLFKNGKWSNPCKLTIKGPWLDDACLNFLADSDLILQELNIKKCNRITPEAFCHFINAGRLATENLRLKIGKGCPWMKDSVIDTLAAKKIKFELLDLDQCRLDSSAGLIRLCHSGAFKSCSEITLPKRLENVFSLMQNLALTRIGTLAINRVEWNKEELLELFENPKNFQYLRILQIGYCRWFDSDCQNVLAQKCPHLNIFKTKFLEGNGTSSSLYTRYN